MLLAWIWRFRPGLWHRDNVLILIGLLRGRGDARAQADRRPPDAAVLPADGGHRDPARDPARRLGRDDRHRRRRGHRRRGERQLARIRDLHLPRRDGRGRGHPPGRPTAGLRPGGDRGLRRQRARRDGLLVAGRPRPARDPRAVVRVGGVGGGFGRRGGRDLRRARVGLRHPDGLPAAGAGQSVAAAAAAAARRDARARTTTR